MRFIILALFTVAMSAGFTSLARAAETTELSVVPTAYQVGTIPINYNTGSLNNYVNFSSTPGSITDISDSSSTTFTELHGIDDGLQPNGFRSDTGTFYLLQYQIDPHAASFTINFTAKLDPYPSLPYGDFLIDCESANNSSIATVLWQVAAQQQSTFGVEFFPNSNTGNFSSFPNWGLDSMLTPEGHLTIVLNGAFWASLDQPGSVTSYLYDVTASYTVPEPRPHCILAVALLPLLLLRNRRSSFQFDSNLERSAELKMGRKSLLLKTAAPFSAGQKEDREMTLAHVRSIDALTAVSPSPRASHACSRGMKALPMLSDRKWWGWFFLLVLGMTVQSIAAVSQAVQWPVSDGGNGHYYEAVITPDLISWTDASAAATARGGYLATITSAAENNFVFSLIDFQQYWTGPFSERYFGPWIGGFQSPTGVEPAGGWEWVTGEPFDYTNWNPGEPNEYKPGEDYLQYYVLVPPLTRAAYWNDATNIDPGSPVSYVVEYDVPEPSTLALLAIGSIGLLGWGRRR